MNNKQRRNKSKQFFRGEEEFRWIGGGRMTVLEEDQAEKLSQAWSFTKADGNPWMRGTF